MLNFKDSVVWVTGSSTGIGRAAARKFASLGADLVIHGLNQQDLTAELAAELTALGRRVLVLDGDLTDEAVVEDFVRQIDETFGRLSVLVNCVGASPAKSRLDDMPIETFDRVLAINIRTQVLATQKALPLLRRADDPAIVNISSSVTRVGGVPGGIAYTTAKGGIDSFTRALARELAPEIRVNAVAPGLVTSPFHDEDPEQKYPWVINAVPMKRVGKPEDMAGAIAFLASPEARYITGETLEVTGGMRLSF